MVDESNGAGSSAANSTVEARDQFLLNAALGRNHWWRWIVGFVVIVVAWVGVGSVALGLAGCGFFGATNLFGIECSRGEFTGTGALSAQLVIFGLGFVVGLLGIWLTLKYVHGKGLGGVVTGRSRFDRSRFLVGMLAALVASLALFAVDVYLFRWEASFRAPDWEFLVFFLVAAVMIPFQAGFEEVFFRGYILNGLVQLFRNRVFLAVVTGVVFGLPHVLNPEPGEYGVVPFLSALVASGIFFAVVVLLDGGLELAWGYHFVNNFFLGVVANTDVSPIETPSLYTLHIDSYDLFPHVLVDVVAFVVVLVVLNAKYRWFDPTLRGARRRAGKPV